MNEDWHGFWTQAISDSPQLVFVLDRQRRVVAVSAALAKALGREPSALVGCNCAGLMHKGGMPAECPLRDLLLDGGVHYAEVRSDALGRDLFIVAMPLLDGDRNIVGALHTAIDITERKRAEAELRTSEARYARAQEVGHVGSWEYDPRTAEFWGSAEARRIYGFGPEPQSFSTDEVEETTPERARVHQALVDLIDSGKEFDLQYEIIPKGSHESRIVSSVAEVQRDEQGDALVVSGVIQDVTERVRAAEALRESAQRYRSLFEDSPVAMWEDDYSAVKTHLEELAAGGIDDVIAHLLAHPEEYARCVELSRTLDANKAAVRLFKAESREELLARNADLYGSGTDRGIDRFWAAMLAGERSATFEEANLTLRGKEIQVLETCTVVPGHEQTFDRVYIADVDITERTRQAATLRESEQLLKQSQQAARVGHYVYDIPAGTWTSSATLDEIFGIGDAYARSVDGWLAIVHPDQRTEMSDYLREHVLRDRLPFDREYRIVRVADGVERWVHGLGTLEMDGGGGVARMFGVIQDVTERRLADDAVRGYAARLRRIVEGAVEAMGHLVETRDPYTAGHERRVAELAAAIAAELGMSAEGLEGLRLAALIHDVGKIAVPAEILAKPGRLSEVEFSLIKQHARTGFEIIEPIDLAGPAAQIVLQHHERLDGSGYPQGLSGRDILFEARIVAVADVVEAMSSHRPYRPALGTDVALAEIRDKSGLAYDPDVAQACLRVFASGFAFTD